ncbi:hypothetical protein SPF06_03555 [Sinomonas sp. JGH33]|uniref:Uncharacterized protein n=1 Tax=Sinomonas terricola TaxID=3110330 RepID=A0ABU5T2B7_9MICC|nr:hypothetical protein [Sinomonas sp. JGH33]MEA5453790.1 hypothetical protein [Sinomonas sp. JGH33]
MARTSLLGVGDPRKSSTPIDPACVGPVLRAEIAAEVPAAQEKAATVIAALLEGLEGDGDYVTNLRTLLRGRYVEDRHMGYVVSAVSAYERMVGDRVHQETAAPMRTFKHSGDPQWAAFAGFRVGVSR